MSQTESFVSSTTQGLPSTAQRIQSTTHRLQSNGASQKPDKLNQQQTGEPGSSYKEPSSSQKEPCSAQTEPGSSHTEPRLSEEEIFLPITKSLSSLEDPRLSQSEPVSSPDGSDDVYKESQSANINAHHGYSVPGESTHMQQEVLDTGCTNREVITAQNHTLNKTTVQDTVDFRTALKISDPNAFVLDTMHAGLSTQSRSEQEMKPSKKKTLLPTQRFDSSSIDIPQGDLQYNYRQQEMHKEGISVHGMEPHTTGITLNRTSSISNESNTLDRASSIESNLSHSELLQGDRISAISNQFEVRVSDKNNPLEDCVSDKSISLEDHVSEKSNPLEDHVSDKSNPLEDHVSDKSNPLEDHVSDKSNPLEDHVSDKSNPLEDHVSDKGNTSEDHVSDKSNTSEDCVSDNSNILEEQVSDNSNPLEDQISEKSNQYCIFEKSDSLEDQVSEKSDPLEDQVSDKSEESSRRSSDIQASSIDISHEVYQPNLFISAPLQLSVVNLQSQTPSSRYLDSIEPDSTPVNIHSTVTSTNNPVNPNQLQDQNLPQSGNQGSPGAGDTQRTRTEHRRRRSADDNQVNKRKCPCLMWICSGILLLALLIFVIITLEIVNFTKKSSYNGVPFEAKPGEKIPAWYCNEYIRNGGDYRDCELPSGKEEESISTKTTTNISPTTTQTLAEQADIGLARPLPNEPEQENTVDMETEPQNEATTPTPTTNGPYQNILVILLGVSFAVGAVLIISAILVAQGVCNKKRCPLLNEYCYMNEPSHRRSRYNSPIDEFVSSARRRSHHRPAHPQRSSSSSISSCSCESDPVESMQMTQVTQVWPPTYREVLAQTRTILDLQEVVIREPPPPYQEIAPSMQQVSSEV